MAIEHGIYKIKDDFFSDHYDEFLKENKNEHRPHYYAFRDKKTNLLWMIPMSHQIAKYQRIIDERIRSNRPCDILHIAKMPDGRESAFLIQDMFPISDNYLSDPYVINGNPLIIRSESLIQTLNKKANVVLTLLRRGIKLTPSQPDVLKIERELLINGKHPSDAIVV